jgi:hypothetical protein
MYGRMKGPSQYLFAPQRGDKGSTAVPRWVLGCPECQQEFTHTEIVTDYRPPEIDPFSWIGDKPQMKEAGVILECPNCKKKTIYKRYQLTYRAT